jgi:GNAT superfamily N-acetyltransferase
MRSPRTGRVTDPGLTPDATVDDGRGLGALLLAAAPDVPAVTIRPARAGEEGQLAEIERAAGACFRDVGMAEIAADEPPSAAELAPFLRADGAWVAVDATDNPVGYLVAAPVDDALHVEQVSVHPTHARHGVGRRLLAHAAAVAAERGLAAVTLTTFVEVPWNAPYYLRCGFRPLADGELTAGLRVIRAREAVHGLDRWPRVCMRRDLRPTAPGRAGSDGGGSTGRHG